MARLSKQLALVAVLLAVFALATSVSALPMRMRRVEMHGAAVVPKLRPRQRTAQIPSLVSPRPRPTQLAAQPAAAAECDNTVIEIEDVFFGPILGVPDAQTNQVSCGRFLFDTAAHSDFVSLVLPLLSSLRTNRISPLFFCST